MWFKKRKCLNCGSENIIFSDAAFFGPPFVRYDRFGKEIPIDTTRKFNQKLRIKYANLYDIVKPYRNNSNVVYCMDCKSWMVAEERHPLFFNRKQSLYDIPTKLLFKGTSEIDAVFCPRCYRPLRYAVGTIAEFRTKRDGSRGELVLDDKGIRSIKLNTSQTYFRCTHCKCLFHLRVKKYKVATEVSPGDIVKTPIFKYDD